MEKILLFLFILSLSNCEQNAKRIETSYVLYDNNVLKLCLYYDELPTKIRIWKNVTPDLYLELNNITINSYDGTTNDFSITIDPLKILIECPNVTTMPDKIIFHNGSEELVVEIEKNKIKKIEFNDPKYY